MVRRGPLVSGRGCGSFEDSGREAEAVLGALAGRPVDLAVRWRAAVPPADLRGAGGAVDRLVLGEQALEGVANRIIEKRVRLTPPTDAGEVLGSKRESLFPTREVTCAEACDFHWKPCTLTRLERRSVHEERHDGGSNPCAVCKSHAVLHNRRRVHERRMPFSYLFESFGFLCLAAVRDQICSDHVLMDSARRGFEPRSCRCVMASWYWGGVVTRFRTREVCGSARLGSGRLSGPTRG